MSSNGNVTVFANGVKTHLSDRDHEKAVAEFLASCDPAILAAISAKYPLLTEHQMRHRQRRELSVGGAIETWRIYSQPPLTEASHAIPPTDSGLQ